MFGSLSEPARYALLDELLITQNGIDCDDLGWLQILTVLISKVVH